MSEGRKIIEGAIRNGRELIAVKGPVWCMGGAWVVHGWCMGGAWVVHGWCMGGAWVVHGWCMVGACVVHPLNLVFPFNLPPSIFLHPTFFHPTLSIKSSPI